MFRNDEFIKDVIVEKDRRKEKERRSRMGFSGQIKDKVKVSSSREVKDLAMDREEYRREY